MWYTLYNLFPEIKKNKKKKKKQRKQKKRELRDIYQHNGCPRNQNEIVCFNQLDLSWREATSSLVQDSLLNFLWFLPMTYKLILWYFLPKYIFTLSTFFTRDKFLPETFVLSTVINVNSSFNFRPRMLQLPYNHHLNYPCRLDGITPLLPYISYHRSYISALKWWFILMAPKSWRSSSN